jgi:putative tricarboxylic transport membrane protein
MIGMFAVSELLRYATATEAPVEVPHQAIVHIFRGLGRVLWRYKVNLLRGNVIGVVIGILPGSGADIAAWISYAVAKRFSAEPEKFGRGHVEGLVDAGAANNSALGGAWVPAMVFGIPGDSITAIVIGVLYMKNMNPGPTILLHAPELLYAVFIVFFVANVLMIPLGYAAIRLSRQILHVPRPILMPVILVFCIVGAFAINNTVFGVGIILVLGLLAFVMEDNGFPIAPAILGIVLGPLVEENFMTTMIKSNGDLSGFFSRPIAAVLGVVTLAIWAWVIVGWGLRARRGPTPGDGHDAGPDPTQ